MSPKNKVTSLLRSLLPSPGGGINSDVSSHQYMSLESDAKANGLQCLLRCLGQHRSEQVVRLILVCAMHVRRAAYRCSVHPYLARLSADTDDVTSQKDGASTWPRAGRVGNTRTGLVRAVYHVWSTLDRRRVYITLNFRGRRRLRPTNCSRVDSDDDSGTDSARTTTTAMHTFIAAWLLCLIQCQVGVFGRSVDDGHQRNAWNKAGGHYTDDRGQSVGPLSPALPSHRRG